VGRSDDLVATGLGKLLQAHKGEVGFPLGNDPRGRTLGVRRCGGCHRSGSLMRREVEARKGRVVDGAIDGKGHSSLLRCELASGLLLPGGKDVRRRCPLVAPAEVGLCHVDGTFCRCVLEGQFSRVEEAVDVSGLDGRQLFLEVCRQVLKLRVAGFRFSLAFREGF
jgi:hypothetical protein